MDKKYGLNMLQSQQFTNVISSLPRDTKVQELCLRYYNQVKKHQTSIQSDKILLNLKCAYYLAEKSQWITNLQGEKVRNAGLSLNQLLKKHSLQEIMFTLKQFAKRITVQDPQTLQDLQKLIKEISFLIAFYSKFEKVLTKIELKTKNNQYTQTLSEFVWLLYIQGKNKVLNRSLELIDNTCMLAHALCFTLIYSWDYNQPAYFTKNQLQLQKLSSRKEINSKIHQKILQLFILNNKSIQSYKHIAQRFQAYFSFLKKNNVIKMTQGKDNFLSPEFIYNNYKRLDYFYTKKLDFNHLDERIFFKDRIANITPNKFTPFARQKLNIPNNLAKGVNGLSDRTRPTNYMSHRILSYQTMQNQQVPQQDVPPSQYKFPKNIMQTPLNTTTPLIQQTPYTTGIMMYNYVNQLSSRLQHKKFCSRKTDQLIFNYIDKILQEAVRDENQKSREIKRNQVFSVCKLISQEYLTHYPHENQNEETIKGLLLMSFEIVFFVSNIDYTFQKLDKQLNTNQLNIWKACDYFLKFDKNMPANLKIHLLDLEVQIVSQKIWKKYQTIVEIQSFLNNQKLSKNQDLIQKLCKRVLHQIAFQIVEICKNCYQNRQQSEMVSEFSFDVMKQVLLEHPYMVWQNNVDQILMCAIFGVSRAFKLGTKFSTIRQAYLVSNAHLSDNKKNDIFTKIQYEKDTSKINDGKTGIIAFYNDCFLAQMNNFLKSRCKDYSSGQRQRYIQKDVNSLLQSPISGILPKENQYGSKKPNSKLPNRGITPRLHAYTESPLLKNQLISIKNPVNSRKAIDFEESEKLLNITKTEPLNQTCKLYQENTQMSNFFHKKFASNKPNLNKLNIQTPSLIKSPCNNPKSPSCKTTSPSPRMKNTLVKQGHSSNIYYTKRDFGKNVNLNTNR